MLRQLPGRCGMCGVSIQIVWPGMECDNIYTGVCHDGYNNGRHQETFSHTERRRRYVSCGVYVRRFYTYLILLYNVWLYGKQTG